MVHIDKFQFKISRWLITALIPILLFISGDLFAGWFPDAITDFSGAATYCKDVGAAPLSVTFTACKSGGGQQSAITVNWYEIGDPGTPVQSDVSTTAVKTFLFTPPTDVVGTFTYYVEIEHPGGACAPPSPLTTGNQVVTVDPLPGIPATPTGPISVSPTTGGLVYVTAGATDATSYLWTNPGGAWSDNGSTTTTLTATSGNSGDNENMIVAGVNSCGTGPNSVGLWVDVVGAPDCPLTTDINISTGETVCQQLATASQLIASINPSGGSGTPTLEYQWWYNTVDDNDPGAGGTELVGETGTTYTPPSGPGEVGTTRYYFCVGFAFDNTCLQTKLTGPATPTQMVKIIDTPVNPDVPTGPTTPLPATGGLVYTTNPVVSATFYTWGYTMGGWSDDASNTTTLTATSGGDADDGFITVSATNSCGTSGTGDLAVNVTPGPDCPLTTDINISAGETVCQQLATASQLIASINLPGGTGTPTLEYQWYYNTIDNNDPTHGSAVELGGETGTTYTPPSGPGEVGTTRYYYCVGFAFDNTCLQTKLTGPATPTQMVKIIDIPVIPDAPTGPIAPLAATGGLVYTTNTVAYATSYNWGNPGGTWSDDASITETLTATSGADTDDGNITVSATNSCGTSPGTGDLFVNVSAGPDCPLTTDINISTGETVCQVNTASQLIATINPSGGSGTPTLEYQWYYNTIDNNDPTHGSAVEIGGETGTTYTPPSGLGEVGTTRYYYCVGFANDNGCGQTKLDGPATPTQMVKIIDTPVNPDVPTGPLTPSTGATGLVYSTNPVASAASYTWTLPTVGWGGSSTTESITATAGGVLDDGIFTVSATNSCGTSGPTSSLAVDVMPLTNHSATQCASCHVFHNAPGATLGTGLGNYLLCVSCHAPAKMAANLAFAESMKSDIPGGTGNSHNWDVPALNPTYEAQMPLDPVLNQWATTAGDKVGCSVCHDQHDDAATKYLRISNAGDALCKDCHRTRDVQRFEDGASNKGSHPVGVVYPDPSSRFNNPPTDSDILTPGGKVECSSCHGVHDVDLSAPLGLTTDGKLLRVANTVDLCTKCHNYGLHDAGGADIDCLVCHQVHNNTKDNIYMIKDNILTPNSGAKDVKFYAQTGINSYVDKDLNYDGICEVCHTLTANHRNNGTEQLHDDASDKRETKCTACHKHSDGFTAPLISTCIGCHSSAQPPIPQIVEPGGEFVQTSNHTDVLPIHQDDCAMCHYEPVGDHPVTDMLLKDPDAVSVWVGDTNVYCVRCHDQDAPTSPQDYSYINTPLYNKSSFIGTPHDFSQNSCMECHNRHGSDNAALLTNNTNYEVCRACHDGTGILPKSSLDIDEAKIADPAGGTGNSHAFNISASVGLQYEANAPSDATLVARLDVSGNIVCSTCHQPHDNGNTKFLSRSNTLDFMCKDCHSVRDRGRYIDNTTLNKGTHPVGLDYAAGGDFKAAPTQSSTQVGPVGGKVECSSCHIAHISPVNDGKLLRQTNDEVLCTDCHNFSTHKNNKCSACHTAHNETKTNIMMIGNFATFTGRTGPNSFADGDANYTAVCEVCHTSKTYFIDDNRAVPGTQGTSHNWDVDAAQPARGAQLPANGEMLERVYSGKIVCVTCHNQHSDAIGPKSLRMSNVDDNMCKDCHQPRALGRYIDNMGANKGSHPVGLANPGAPEYNPSPTNLSYSPGGNVECSSCHGVHDVLGGTLSTDGNLLKMDNDNLLCKDCHNYLPHQGFECLDCHQPHGGTNIMLIRSQIDIDGGPGVNLKDVVFNSQGSNAPIQPQFAPNSFADGDPTFYDGICEVCHTTPGHHRNDGSDGTAHNDGKRCTQCHAHNDAVTSFPNGSCHDCHERDFPGETQLYPATGAHAKHAGAQYEFKCSECHWGAGGHDPGDPVWPGESGHSNSSVDVIFNPTGLASRGGLDLPSPGPPNWAGATPTWDGGTKTCSNIYCHSTGESAYRGQDVDDTWGGKGPFGSEQPTYTNPVWTASITACTSCHGGKGNMTSPYTIDMGSPNAHLILDYGTDAPLSGLHPHTGMYNDSQDGTGPTGSGAVQCYLCHNTNGATNGGTNFQGTYGTTFHVDGQTHFKFGTFSGGGYWANWETHMVHCQGKANWK